MPPKIAYMTHNGRIPSRKADGVAVMNTCSQLASHGFDVELILPKGDAACDKTLLREGNIWGFYEVPENFRITYFPCPYLCSLWRHLGYSLLALSYAAYQGKSVIYARQIELALSAVIYGKICIFESHNYVKVARHPLVGHWVRSLRNSQRQVAMVVTTQAAAQSYEDLGVPRKRILVSPNGVDVKRFACSQPRDEVRRSLGLPLEKTIVGFCGHLYPGRGVEELLECATRLHQVFFVIVGGEPDDVQRWEKKALELGLTNVVFVGFVPQLKVPNYLFASDILVMPYTKATPSHQYMSPMKMFDYLASGRAIVATDFPVIREVLHDRKNAVIVPPGNARTLVSAIQWLIDHPKSAEKLGNQARWDADQYSWENRVGRIVTWMRESFFGHAALGGSSTT